MGVSVGVAVGNGVNVGVGVGMRVNVGGSRLGGVEDGRRRATAIRVGIGWAFGWVAQPTKKNNPSQTTSAYRRHPLPRIM